MHIRVYESAEAFRDHAWSTLMEREGENNLILGTISRLVDGQINKAELLASVEEYGNAVGACVKTPLRGVSLTRLPPAAIPRLAETAGAKLVDIPSVHGPSETAREFSQAWASLRGLVPRLRFRFLGYELKEVIPAPSASGAMRPTGPDESDLVADWAAAMVEELDMQMPDVREQAHRWVKRSESFIWWDGKPVAMAQFQLATPTCPRVRMVYTPPESRRNGYATALVAALSARLLASGCPRCFLFTDENNPTSNGIYQKIGYRPVCDYEDYRFE